MMSPWDRLLTPERLFMPSSPRSAPDQRSEFERDYDRLIFASPFRRLQDKAQVFPLEHNDFIRTRLTHSLEVSTLGRSLGRQVAMRLARDRGVSLSSDDLGTIVATTCLAHDIGNPPFGHAGEDAIKRWFHSHPEMLAGMTEAQQGDFLKFDGNAQGLRILTFLQSLGYDNGLNLTAATLSAFMKYVASSTGIQKGKKSRKKLGYLQSEAGKVARMRALTGLPDGMRHPLVYLMEAADDIAYSVVDIEDAFKKQVLRADAFEARLDVGLAGTDFRWMLEKFHRRCTRAEEGTYFERLSAAVQWLRIDAIGAMFGAVVDAFMAHYEAILDGTYELELMESSAAAPLWQALKDVGIEEIYRAPAVLELEVFGERVIHDLLDHFVPACLSEERDDLSRPMGKRFALISSSLRSLQKRHTQMHPYDCVQLAVDHVCGMTDTYAVTVYQKLNGLAPAR